MIHGDYNRITADGLLHSVTNYECYKGLYSAFNSMNLFEIAHSLGRQFGPEPWTLYRGKHLMNFADNHDVTRIASILNDEKQIYPLYGVLFAMPGIPCLYYGSEWGLQGDKRDGDPALRPALERPEWGAKGEKHEGDNALRPCFDAPVENELTAFIEKLAKVKTESRALNYGDYKNITIQNKNLLFERHCDHETVFVAVNAENAPCSIDARGEYKAVDFLTGETSDIHGRVELPPYFLEKADVSPKSVDTSAFCRVYGVFIPPSPFLFSIGAKCAFQALRCTTAKCRVHRQLPFACAPFAGSAQTAAP